MDDRDKGQEARGCGASPQPQLQPLRHKQAAAHRYHFQTPPRVDSISLGGKILSLYKQGKPCSPCAMGICQKRGASG